MILILDIVALLLALPVALGALVMLTLSVAAVFFGVGMRIHDAVRGKK